MATGTTLRFIIMDPLETLKQTVKDREIQPVQMAYWAVVLMNRIKAQHIEKRSSGAFLTTFTSVPVVFPTATATTNVVENRPHFVLPSVIFDFDMDGAVEYIAYTSDGSPGCPPEFTYVRFHRTTPSEAWHLYGDSYMQPGPDNPYWYRTQNIITLLGVEKIPIEAVEVGLYLPVAQVDQIDLDAPVEFPEELIQVLQRQLLDLGRWNLLVPKDRAADGDFDPSNAVPTNKIASVNDPSIQQQQ
jgi:hypothetical protein